MPSQPLEPSYAPKFDSEDSLRQTVAKLLRRIPNIDDVQLLHGRQEYGKDIVFRTVAPLGDVTYCACVVKNGKISGTADSTSGARTVLHQAEQALDTPFLGASGQDLYIHHVYVITPEEITQEAMASIRGKLATRSGQITFLNGSRLFELLRTYWADFFYDEFVLLEESIRDLSQRGLTADLREAAASYGLRPPDDFEKTIYVVRKLTRTIAVYDTNFTTAQLPQRHSEEANEWLSFLRRLSKAIAHLQRWSFANVTYPGGVGRFSAWLSDVARELEQEYRKQKEDELFKSLTEGRKVVETAIRDRNPKLAQTAEEVCRLVEVTLKPVTSANQHASSALASKSSDLSILLSPLAILGGNMTDCLTAAPIAMLKSRTSRTFTVTEEEVRSSSQSWFIVGPAGYGKTSFCRWNALVDAENYRNGSAKIFPVYLPLNVLVRRKLNSFREAFLGTAGQSALLPEDAVEPTTSAGFLIRLYLDGLDEVASIEARRRIAGLAREAFDSGLQIVLTSRDYIRMPELSWLPRISLDMFDEQSQAELARQILGSGEPYLEFLRQLRSSAALHGIFGVPLMARLILLVFRETGEVPENRSRLYRTFVDLLLGGWDLAKRVVRDSRFGRAIKTTVLCKLAHKVHEERLRIFGISVLQSAIRTCANTLEPREIDALCGELVRDGLLSHSANTFYFSHMSFQEYLCASYYQGSPNTDEVDAVLARCLAGDDWWREVLAFYIGLSESPDMVATWLIERSIKNKVGAAAVMAYFREAFPRYRSDLLDSQR